MSILTTVRERYEELGPTARVRLGIGIAVLLCLAIGYSYGTDQLKRLQLKRANREQAVAEMMILKQRYQEASSGAQRINNRLAATKADDSPAKLLDEIGIKGKNLQIKPVKGDDRPGVVEDAAEIKIDGLSANEAVNLLHRLEKGSRPVVLKKTLVRSRFDDPAKLDLNLTIALLKQAPQAQR
jgi:general secretion pathway protein M